MKRRWIRTVLAVLTAFLLPALAFCGALAEGGQVAMRIVSCPEQGFSTLCRPEYDYWFTPDGGLTLELGDAEDAAFVTIFKTDAPGADFDAVYYLGNVYARQLRSNYGGDLTSVSAPSETTLGGRKLTTCMALYRSGGRARMRFCAYDLRESCFVRYEAVSLQEDGEMEAALRALAVAVGNFRPDADYYSGQR